ncbi:MAG TPA: helix-turn-helix domain-containing protein [Pirellulales bacterium]|jgi:excisionase family DNA binding protein
MKREPGSLPQFGRWLEEACDEIEFFCRYVDPDFFDRLAVAQIIEQASRHASRFGAGHLVSSLPPTFKPDDGLAIVGRLLEWTRERTSEPAAMLSVKELSQRLGIASRTVWRMLSAGELPAPIKIGGQTKWRRSEIEAMIDLAPMKGHH